MFKRTWQVVFWAARNISGIPKQLAGIFSSKVENQSYLFCINVYHGMIRIQHYLLSLQTNQSDMTGHSINRIRVALAERNKTNRWLAEQMGKSEITISRWVQNKAQPSLEQLLQVAQILSVSPKDLINDVKSESSLEIIE